MRGTGSESVRPLVRTKKRKKQGRRRETHSKYRVKKGKGDGNREEAAIWVHSTQDAVRCAWVGRRSAVSCVLLKWSRNAVIRVEATRSGLQQWLPAVASSSGLGQIAFRDFASHATQLCMLSFHVLVQARTQRSKSVLKGRPEASTSGLAPRTCRPWGARRTLPDCCW